MGPVERKTGENPYDIQRDLQEVMQSLVGIIRTESELKEAVTQIGRLEDARPGRACREAWSTTRAGTSPWTSRTSSRCPAPSRSPRSRPRKESRGGHTRDDYPQSDAQLAKVNVVVRIKGGELQVAQEPLPAIPGALQSLLEEKK